MNPLREVTEFAPPPPQYNVPLTISQNQEEQQQELFCTT